MPAAGRRRNTTKRIRHRTPPTRRPCRTPGGGLRRRRSVPRQLQVHATREAPGWRSTSSRFRRFARTIGVRDGAARARKPGSYRTRSRRISLSEPAIRRPPGRRAANAADSAREQVPGRADLDRTLLPATSGISAPPLRVPECAGAERPPLACERQQAWMLITCPPRTRTTCVVAGRRYAMQHPPRRHRLSDGLSIALV
jgi:hypothetical protein